MKKEIDVLQGKISILNDMTKRYKKYTSNKRDFESENFR